jgi:RimJ/RimL family protein N-acetyltransferase
MRDLPLIHGKTIILRPFDPSDAADYSAWLKDEYLRRVVGESQLTPAEVVSKQEEWARDEKMVEYIITDKASGKPIGDIIENNISNATGDTPKSLQTQIRGAGLPLHYFCDPL